MANSVKPYSEQGSKKQQVGNMFDNIAPYYDLLNRVLSLGIDQRWRKAMIRELAKVPHAQVLDVATGTADVALAIRKNLPDVQHITGLDLSHEMLEVGRQKIAKKNWTADIDMIQGDSENLPFADDSFDAITVAFGVRNFENLEAGLREMHRVLRPGGKLLVLEFSRPTVFPLKQGFNFYFKNILPQIGKWQSKDPRAYEYLYESVQAFPDGADFLAVLARTGYSATTVDPQTFGICSLYTGVKG